MGPLASPSAAARPLASLGPPHGSARLAFGCGSPPRFARTPSWVRSPRLRLRLADQLAAGYPPPRQRVTMRMARPRRAGTMTLQRRARSTRRSVGPRGRPGRGGSRNVISLVRTKRPRDRTAKKTRTHLKAAPTSADAQLDPTQRLHLIPQLG